MNQRLKIAPHVNVRRRFLGVRVGYNPQKVFRPRFALILYIGQKAQYLALALPQHLEADSDKRRVINCDADLLDGRDQK